MILKDYKPNGLDVELPVNGDIVKVMVVKKTPKNYIIAKIKDKGRICLWEGDDVIPNLNATDEQIADRVKIVLG